MPDPANRNEQDGRRHDATAVRGGEIILRSRWQRAVFIAGLAAPIVLGVIWGLA